MTGFCPILSEFVIVLHNILPTTSPLADFSEEIVLPSEDAQDAFSIENQSDLTMLTVNSAKMDEDDNENKTVN